MKGLFDNNSLEDMGRIQIVLADITLDFLFILVEWIICDRLIWIILSYMLKKKTQQTQGQMEVSEAHSLSCWEI